MKTGSLTLALLLGVAVVVSSQGVTFARQMGGGGRSQAQAEQMPPRDADETDYSTQPTPAYRGGGGRRCYDEPCGDGPCCDDQYCEEACLESCGCGPCAGGWNIYGDFLYIRPRNAEVVYAVPMNGPETSPPDVPIQFGRIATVDMDYTPTFRVGLEKNLSCASSIGVSYTQLFSDTSDSIEIDAPYVIRSTVTHPSTWDAESDGLFAEADYSLNYKLMDVDYRYTFLCGPTHRVNYVAGVRYGHLDQELRSNFTTLVGPNDQTVDTDINFDGGGIRLGLEGESQIGCRGWLAYGRANASFVAGEFHARYNQSRVLDPDIVVANWKAGRIVPMLDLELGIGWASCSGCLRVTAGYMVSAWYNTVTTTDWIGAVQHNDFSGLHDTLTFDGFVLRSELRF